MVMSCPCSSSLWSWPAQRTGRSAASWSTGGPTSPSLGENHWQADGRRQGPNSELWHVEALGGGGAVPGDWSAHFPHCSQMSLLTWPSPRCSRQEWTSGATFVELKAVTMAVDLHKTNKKLNQILQENLRCIRLVLFRSFSTFIIIIHNPKSVIFDNP